MGAALAGNVLHFARYLRARGLDVTTATGVDLLAAARLLGLVKHQDVCAGFRALAVTRPEHIPVFDESFQLFFGNARRGDAAVSSSPADAAPVKVPVLTPEVDDGAGETSDGVDQMGASYREQLRTRDFGDLSPDEIAEVRRLISRMAWHPAEALSRRLRSDPKGRRPDMRRTLRNAVGQRSDLIEMKFSSPKPRRRPLVILADVSGSMEKYAEMLLYFAHAAPARMGKVETFVFSTRLTRITHELRRRDPAAALRLAAGRVRDWSGGTRIGEALETYNRFWSRRVARGGPIGVIISDGWDRGDPRLLEEEMSRFARSVHRVVWLNPLAGRAGYSPETRGLKAALPFVDDFLASASLSDLTEVVRLLETIPARIRRGAVPAGTAVAAV